MTLRSSSFLLPVLRRSRCALPLTYVLHCRHCSRLNTSSINIILADCYSKCTKYFIETQGILRCARLLPYLLTSATWLWVRWALVTLKTRPWDPLSPGTQARGQETSAGGESVTRPRGAVNSGRNGLSYQHGGWRERQGTRQIKFK